MLYSLLGRLVWKFAKRKLRSRGPGRRPLASGGLLAAAAGLVALLLRGRFKRGRGI